MKTRCSLFVLSMLMLVAVPAAQAQQEIPQTIAYQGYLTNTDGDPANGATGVVFRLYDDEAAGAQVWQEVQPNVVFTDGVFSVRLGSVVSLEAVPFDGPLWLSVAIQGGAELQPRVALEVVPYAYSLRHLRVVPGTSQIAPSPNLIGGHVENNITDDAINGATIGGGGVAGEPNIVAADFGTVGGGLNNQAGSIATVGGGSGNVAGVHATVAGGSSNTAGRNATIGGGISNEASDERATVGGGANNTASGDRSTIGGGESNTAGRYATIGGGQVNNAEGFSATVGGGTSNEAAGEYATVAGGRGNEASANESFIGGGRDNRAEGLVSMVPGGFQNHAMGFASFAAGYNARAVHNGAFVWTDTEGIPVPFSSTAEDQFLIRAAGGVGVGTNTPQGALHTQAADDDTPDLVLGGTDGDDNGLITSDLTLPSSDINLFSNGGVGIKLDSNSDEANALFFITDGEEDLVFAVGETGRIGASELVINGTAAVGVLEADDDLGDTDTPAEGGVYRDNVVYAWAHVQGNGSATASFGCSVTRLGLGRYRIDYDLALPNGMAPVVSPLSANDPVIATVSPSGNDGATVVVFDFVGGQFQAGDRAFFIQVVGRP